MLTRTPPSLRPVIMRSMRASLLLAGACLFGCGGPDEGSRPPSDSGTGAGRDEAAVLRSIDFDTILRRHPDHEEEWDRTLARVIDDPASLHGSDDAAAALDGLVLPAGAEYPEALALASSFMAKTGAYETIEFGSSGGPGARVRYVHIGLVDRKDPDSTSGFTDGAVADLVWGLYYVWTEREGEPTSDTETIFRIDHATRSPIVIEERVAPSSSR